MIQMLFSEMVENQDLVAVRHGSSMDLRRGMITWAHDHAVGAAIRVRHAGLDSGQQ